MGPLTCQHLPRSRSHLRQGSVGTPQDVQRHTGASHMSSSVAYLTPKCSGKFFYLDSPPFQPYYTGR